jgi:alkylmercury lyase
MNQTIDIRALSASLNGAFPRLDGTDQRIAIATYRLLARGRAATTHEISKTVGLAGDELAARMRTWPAVFRDGSGAVVGFWGLSPSDVSPHTLDLNGVQLWAWCAWDTLFLPARLGSRIHVRSLCPVTHETIELDVEPDRIEEAPKDVVVSFLSPDNRFDGDVITNFCHFIHFFASRGAGEQWVAAHSHTFLLSLSEAFELARLANGLFADVLPPIVSPTSR